MTKKIITFIVLVATFMCCWAQRPEHQNRQRKPIEEMVSDLSSIQKKRLENISTESRERISELKASQKRVRDSIHTYMEMDADMSSQLFPLFDRETAIQAEISREMYSTRVKIDKVLTKEQRLEFKSKMAAERAKNHANKGKGNKGQCSKGDKNQCSHSK